MTTTDAWFAPASITMFEVTARASTWTFVELRDRDGLTGLAEVTWRDGEAVASRLARLANRLRGERLGSDGDVVAKLGLEPASLRQDIVLATALSGIRSAVTDALARRAGLSLGSFLRLSAGESPVVEPSRVKLYANINRALLPQPRPRPGMLPASGPVERLPDADRSPEGFAAMAKRATDAGFAALKCAPFDECRAPFKSEGLPPEARAGLERVEAAKQAVGPDRPVYVDCHSRFDLQSAVALEPQLRGSGGAWFEEPVDPLTRTDDLRRIHEASKLPLAGGEHGYSLDVFKRLLDTGALDIVMPDVKHCGGVAEAYNIGQDIESQRPGSVSLHCPSGPVSLLASAHVTAAFGGALPLEHAVFEVEWRPEVTWPRERIEKGQLALPPGAGLGAVLDYSAALAHGRQWSP